MALTGRGPQTRITGAWDATTAGVAARNQADNLLSILKTPTGLQALQEVIMAGSVPEVKPSLQEISDFLDGVLVE